ncbi:uncharacterized protein isoform X2 [Leptinotarsa decemlineata]|uniref:uncharacterized protein isoform X2 n=1 Tax=Leptinotarsa decemlineata TaxID=7539 RepID=UPI003D30860F
MSHGKINEFQIGSSWKTYVARVKQYFIANGITDELKIPTLITVVGDTTYELMVDLCSPDAPEDKSCDTLVEIVKNHLEPDPSVIAERHKFRLKRQNGEETVAEYMAALKNLAKTCDFKDSLEENLRDQFVSGLYNDTIKQRLFSEKFLNYARAYEIARNMEAAEKQVSSVTKHHFGRIS